MIQLHIDIEVQNQINMGDQIKQQIDQNLVSQPTQISEKPKINYFVVGLVVIVCFILFGIGGFYLGKQSSKTTNEEQNQSTPSPSTAETDLTANWKLYTFQPLQLSLKVPSELTVHTEEPNPGNDFTAYIQNFPFNTPFPTENAYQLYIIWQKTPTVTETEFKQLKNDLDNSTVKDTTIAGYPAIKGQVKGERNRLVTYILKGNTKISLFTSEPTEINRILTDQILSTITVINSQCGTCPQLMPPAPDFCSDGTIISGGKNACGCQLPPTCKRDASASINIKYSFKSNWTTYTDDVAGFSFQYNTTPTQPYSSHQSLGNNQAGKSVMINGCNTPPNNQEVCLEQYTVTVYTNYDGGSRRDWMSKNINDYPNCQRYYSDVSVAGKNAMLTTSDCSSWGETYILIPNGSQMVVFLTKGYSRNDTTGKITLQAWINEVLSTFKYIQ